MITASSFYDYDANSFYINPGEANTSNFTVYASTGKAYFAGNVGIGTTAPSATLHVNGNIKAVLNTLGAGDVDMIIGSYSGNSYGYENSGTKTSPTWTRRGSWDVPDVGSYSAPAFADLDNDGDYDLMLGEASGYVYGYENIGDNINPYWQAKSSWNTADVGVNSDPILADLDNDGDYDILIGTTTGTCQAYKNTGTVYSPVWTNEDTWDVPDIGGYSSPALADLDGDGDYDIVVGDDGGISYAYENIGSSTAPSWSAKATWNLPDIADGDYASPALADLDNDGDYDAIIGSYNGTGHAYKNIGSSTAPVWSNEDTWNTADIGLWSNPALIDLDRDGERLIYDPDSDEIGYDIAELYKTNEEVSPGDIVSISSEAKLLEKSREEYDQKAVGIVSSSPAILFEGSRLQIAPDAHGFKRGTRPPIALAGRIMTKVSNINGAIAEGDPITSSQLAGFGAKAVRVGSIIGKALESFDPENGLGETTACPQETPEGVICGKMLIFINLSWYDPNVFLTDTGDLQIILSGQVATDSGQPEDEYLVQKTGGQLVKQISAFAQTVIGKVAAGLVKTDRLVADSKIISPLVETDEIRGLESNDVVINLTSKTGATSPSVGFGQLLIKGELGETVASVDSSGDATFSGNVAIGSLETPEAKIEDLQAGLIETESIVGQEATFSAIYADRIISKEGSFEKVLTDKIAAIRGELEELVTGRHYDTGVDKPTAQELDTTTTGTSLLGQTENWSTESASGSAQIDPGSDLGPLSLLTNLVVQEQLTVEEAFVNRSALIGNIAITNDAVSSLSNALYLQPTGLGKIDLMAGVMTIEDNGEVVINGSLTVNGRLAAAEYTGPDGNVVVSLGTGETAPDAPSDASKSGFGQLLVKGVDEKTVAAIDASGSARFAGDLTASGSASFAKLNISTDATASAIVASQSGFGQLATTSAEIRTNASAGKGEILAGKTEVVIYTDKLTTDSLVYITPTSDTGNQVLYVKNKYVPQETDPDGESYFTVRLNTPLEIGTSFNWWIIN